MDEENGSPARVIYAVLVLVLAGITGFTGSWWVAGGLIVIGVVLILKPAWRGGDWWF